MSPRFAQPNQEFVAWSEAHRCAICNAPAARMSSEMVDEFRMLKPQYRYLASAGVSAEPWQTDFVGGEYRVEIECENGHVFTSHDVRFVKDKA